MTDIIDHKPTCLYTNLLIFHAPKVDDIANGKITNIIDFLLKYT